MSLLIMGSITEKKIIILNQSTLQLVLETKDKQEIYMLQNSLSPYQPTQERKIQNNLLDAR